MGQKRILLRPGYSLLYRRQGIYRFRKFAPKDLREIFGKREIKVSLHTNDLDTAKMRRGAKWWLGLGALVGFALLWVHSASAKTFEWREEVVLHDGGMILISWWVRLVPGQPFQYMVGEQRLAFTHPATGQPVTWVDTGKIGSRLDPILLDVDAGRLYLVESARTGTDYDAFGCPTPPYIAFRYDAGSWTRIPLSELPMRFSNANLVGFDEDLIRGAKGYLTAAQVKTWLDGVARRPDIGYMGRIDRRIRNPLALGCSRGALERIYGEGKYHAWRNTGTWLDKTEEEAHRMLRGTREGAKP